VGRDGIPQRVVNPLSAVANRAQIANRPTFELNQAVGELAGNY
jgi:hypothetical protein